jgi:hypothetical protein
MCWTQRIVYYLLAFIHYTIPRKIHTQGGVYKWYRGERDKNTEGVRCGYEMCGEIRWVWYDVVIPCGVVIKGLKKVGTNELSEPCVYSEADPLRVGGVAVKLSPN